MLLDDGMGRCQRQDEPWGEVRTVPSRELEKVPTDAFLALRVVRSCSHSPSSGYCFLTFSSAADASRALSRFNAAPPVLMPRSGKTFKLNWGTGLPGSQPTWDGEFSVFVGDLAREVGEADLLVRLTLHSLRF